MSPYEHDLMIINKSGITIRLKVADFRIMGRNTQGVRLINLEKRHDEIASVCRVQSETAEEEAETESAIEAETSEFSHDALAAEEVPTDE